MSDKKRGKGKRKRIHWTYTSGRLKRPTSVSVSVRAYSQANRYWTQSATDVVKDVFTATRVRSRTPGANPTNFRYKIANHISATSSFDATKFWYNAKQYRGKARLIAAPAYWGTGDRISSCERFGTGDGYSLISDLPTTPPLFSGSTYTSAYNLAVQRLYDTIREMESHVQTGETIGEYKQTIKLLKRGLGGLRDLIDHVSKDHVKILKKEQAWNNTKRMAKSLADLTLEYRFGIEPLAKVLGEGAGAIQSDSYMEAFLPFSVSGKAISTIEENNTTWGAFPTMHLRTLRDSEQKVRFKGEYRLRSKEDGPSYARSLGLTWRELTPTLYNLCPYSFLLDYVVNLHTFIETLAVPFSSVAWCVRTERSQEVNRRLYDFRNGDQNVLFMLEDSEAGYFQAGATGIRRREQVSLPMPILQWKKPSKRALENILALVAGRLPIIGSLTKRILRSPSGKSLDNEFRLAVRDRNLKVPYPFHSAS